MDNGCAYETHGPYKSRDGDRVCWVAISPSGCSVPDEILVMDAPRIADAVRLLRMDKFGLWHSSDGYKGHYNPVELDNGSGFDRPFEANEASAAANPANPAVYTICCERESVCRMIAGRILDGYQ